MMIPEMLAAPGGLGALLHMILADPTLILTAVSATVSAASSVMQGNQQAGALDAQAKAQDEAAITAEREGAANESAQRIQNRRLLGEQIASAGANGLTLSGSVKDFTLDSAVDQEMQALNLRYQAATQARGLRVGAAQDRAAAKSAKLNGYLGGAAALIGGGADVYGKISGGGSGSSPGGLSLSRGGGSLVRRG